MTQYLYLMNEHLCIHFNNNIANISSFKELTKKQKKCIKYGQYIKIDNISDIFCKNKITTVIFNTYINIINISNLLPINVIYIYFNCIGSIITVKNENICIYTNYLNYLPNMLNKIKLPGLILYKQLIQLDKLPSNINSLCMDYQTYNKQFLLDIKINNLPVLLSNLSIHSNLNVHLDCLPNIKVLNLIYYTGKMNISILPNSITTLITNTHNTGIIYNIPHNITTLMFNISFTKSISRINKKDINILCPNLKKVDIMWAICYEPLDKINARIRSIFGDSIQINYHDESKIKDLYKNTN